MPEEPPPNNGSRTHRTEITPRTVVEHEDMTPLLPQPFATMREGGNDPAEVAAVQRFLLKVGGPSIAMKLLPGGADGKYDARMSKAVSAYQEKFGVEGAEKGVLDLKTVRHMSELREELATQDRRPDALAHILNQIPDDPMHPHETSTGPHAKLRSAQLHAIDQTRDAKATRPDPETTKHIQDILQKRGYDIGPEGVDGKPGRYFHNALRDYQRDAGLSPIGLLKNGGLDPATHELLKMDEEFQAARRPAPAAAPETAPDTPMSGQGVDTGQLSQAMTGLQAEPPPAAPTPQAPVSFGVGAPPIPMEQRSWSEVGPLPPGFGGWHDTSARPSFLAPSGEPNISIHIGFGTGRPMTAPPTVISPVTTFPQGRSYGGRPAFGVAVRLKF